jgi:hypothetical protein
MFKYIKAKAINAIFTDKAIINSVNTRKNTFSVL